MQHLADSEIELQASTVHTRGTHINFLAIDVMLCSCLYKI